MLQDDFNKLMEYFQQINEGKQVDLQEVIKVYFTFMEDLKGSLDVNSEEERVAMMKSITGMYQQILKEARKASEKTGMTEEQLAAFASNPANFSEETWRTLQEARQKMTEASKELSEMLAKRREAIEGPKKRPTPKPNPPAKNPRASKAATSGCAPKYRFGG